MQIAPGKHKAFQKEKRLWKQVPQIKLSNHRTLKPPFQQTFLPPRHLIPRKAHTENVKTVGKNAKSPTTAKLCFSTLIFIGKHGAHGCELHSESSNSPQWCPLNFITTTSKLRAKPIKQTNKQTYLFKLLATQAAFVLFQCRLYVSMFIQQPQCCGRV